MAVLWYYLALEMPSPMWEHLMYPGQQGVVRGRIEPLGAMGAPNLPGVHVVGGFLN